MIDVVGEARPLLGKGREVEYQELAKFMNDCIYIFDSKI